MKKLSLILAVLCLAGYVYAANEPFSAGQDNPTARVPGVVNSYSKDYTMIIPLTGNEKDTVGTVVKGFMCPESAELMKAWLLCGADSTMAVDTVTNYWRAEIFSNAGGSADTAMYYTSLHTSITAAATALQIKAAIAESLIFTTTITKRQFDKGEVGLVKWTPSGTPTHFPKYMQMIMLFRPKSWPVAADYYTR